MDKLVTFSHVTTLLGLFLLFLVCKGLDRIHDELTEFHKDYVERTEGDRFE